MKFTQLEIAGVWLIEPVRHSDARGYFAETFRVDEFERTIGHVEFVQENESMSSRGVLRGLHFQRGADSQAKLVKVSRGTILDVAVDLRPGSPTSGRSIMVELSADNGRQLFIPRGFAHGFLVLSDVAQFQYKVDNFYAPRSEATLRYDDPTVGVAWPLEGIDVLLSPKDLAGLSYDEILKLIEE